MHIVFDIDLTLLDGVEVDNVLHDQRLHHSDLISFPIGNDYIAFVRPFAIQFIQMAIHLGNEISIWTRATRPYAQDVAKFFLSIIDGLEFKYIYTDVNCPAIQGAWRKPLHWIDGDLLIDDNLENRLQNEYKFVQCPPFYALNKRDDFFLELFNHMLMYDDWDITIFEPYIS